MVVPQHTGKNHLFCFGYGYTADYLGHVLKDDPNWIISGTTRDHDKHGALEARGINAHIFNQEDPLSDAARSLASVTHVLISVPPDDNGDPVYNALADRISRMPALSWLGYLSTTSVYGNRDGAKVTEGDNPRPDSQRGSRRLLAEEQWLSLFKNDIFPTHIFRLAGIYGPGRSALDSVRAGIARRVNKPGQKFNRVHVEDIVQVLLASMKSPNASRIYNVADDLPSPSHEIIAYACEMLNRPPPPMVPYEQANFPPMARSFYASNKYVVNDRIKEELGVTLQYPTYKEGLKACLDAENYARAIFSGMDQ